MALRILSAGSTLHAVRECAALGLFSHNPEIEIATDHGHAIFEAIERGTADADVVLIPAGMIAKLQEAALTHEAVMLGSVGIGGAVRSGANVPRIATLKEFLGAVIAADAVLLTRAPTGDHLAEVTNALGVGAAVAPKLLRFDTSTALNLHLAAREDNALGFGPETEIRAGRGVSWIGDVPDEIQVALPYAATILTTATAGAAAEAFLSVLATDAAREVFRRSGVKPA